jgi:hypothetical protein
MKFRFSLLAVLGAALSFSACDNEIDLVAPYQETGVIYGLLNQADSVQYVRIQKAFLGAGNANVMAQVTDSTYYPDILEVQLQRLQYGQVVSFENLTRFVAPDKNEGVFPVAPNIMYKTSGAPLVKGYEYKIWVRNTQSGHEFYATTPLVDSLIISRPTRNVNSFINFANEDFPFNVEYNTGKNGKVFNLTIRFHYGEEVIGSGGLVEAKSVDWVFPNKIVQDPTVSQQIRISIDGESFYQFLGEKLQANSNILRYAGGLDFIFTSGAEVLANYVAINQAATSILTTAPNYSNVTGGTGVFSSRYVQSIPNKQLDQPSKDLLVTSPYTSDLNFQ